MLKSHANVNPFLAVFALLLLSAMLLVVPVSGKSALGSSDFRIDNILGNSVSNALIVLEKVENSRLAVLEISDVPEDIVPPKTNTYTGDVTSPDFVGPTVPKVERLKIINQRLSEAPAAKNADEAMQLLHKTFDDVEDAFSGVPKVDNPGLKYQGRVYAPREDYTTRLPDGGLEAVTKGNIVRISPSGDIQFFIKNSDGSAGKLVFTKKGAGQ